MRGRQQCCKIRADGVKGDEAHIQQAGVAHDDVQPERQHDVQQSEVDHAHPVVAAELACHHGSNQQGEDEQGHAGPEAALRDGCL
ncbi:hypothetical protein D3C80_2057450 [compost metagenome]